MIKYTGVETTREWHEVQMFHQKWRKINRWDYLWQHVLENKTIGLIYQTNYMPLCPENNLKPTSMLTHTQIFKGQDYCLLYHRGHDYCVWKLGKHYTFDNFENNFYWRPGGLWVCGAHHVITASFPIPRSPHFLSVHSPVKTWNAPQKFQLLFPQTIASCLLISHLIAATVLHFCFYSIHIILLKLDRKLIIKRHFISNPHICEYTVCKSTDSTCSLTCWRAL